MKKRRVSFSNKLAYSIIAFAILMLIAFGVNALSPGVAPNPGHTIDTVSPPSTCLANQYLQWDGSAWKCSNSAGGISGSGHQGRVAVFTGGITTTQITDSRIWEDAGPLGWRMGFGGEPDVLNGNDGIDVYGDIQAEGDICANNGADCLGASSGLTVSNEFTAIAPNSVSMGVHTFCFLTRTANLIDTNAQFDCRISRVSSMGDWILSATGTNGEVTCVARCVD